VADDCAPRRRGRVAGMRRAPGSPFRGRTATLGRRERPDPYHQPKSAEPRLAPLRTPLTGPPPEVTLELVASRSKYQ
jgi:hypothetical protein